MPTLTVRNVPESALKVLKRTSALKGCSMEQELRDLISQRYVDKKIVLKEIKNSWKGLPKVSASQIKTWREQRRK